MRQQGWLGGNLGDKITIAVGKPGVKDVRRTYSVNHCIASNLMFTNTYSYVHNFARITHVSLDFYFPNFNFFARRFPKEKKDILMLASSQVRQCPVGMLIVDILIFNFCAVTFATFIALYIRHLCLCTIKIHSIPIGI